MFLKLYIGDYSLVKNAFKQNQKKRKSDLQNKSSFRDTPQFSLAAKGISCGLGNDVTPQSANKS